MGTDHPPSGLCLSAESPCQDLRNDYEGFSFFPCDQETESSRQFLPHPHHTTTCVTTARMCMKTLEITALEQCSEAGNVI